LGSGFQAKLIDSARVLLFTYLAREGTVSLCGLRPDEGCPIELA